MVPEHNAITISNPPFGRNNSLSIPFFNRAAEHSEYIAFIVPRSWRKWSVINRLNRNFHLVLDEDLQIDYVDDTHTLISQKNLLKTCFQVWQRRDELRDLVKIEDKGFVTKVKPDEADIALQIRMFIFPDDDCPLAKRARQTSRWTLTILARCAIFAFASLFHDRSA